ncbi:LysM peptidoglycan-binding domain-containing protein [Pedobacter changchengzhani]|uniref:Peptidoglycan hydrolase n=1 Tax=Pedobacter changchengzhani TaxID=2529274 RepID=A0A4R5MPH1_9SPHI|nr:glucosaminidase domain-containing protein [Pedobacter changchengzhani]TDG37526.1 LysM peptidoglycan-binding domain-containing protein [Pedobacter changchengzhani]
MRLSIRLIFLLVSVVFFSACKTRKFAQNNKQIEKQASKNNNNTFKSYNTLSYIDEFKAVAIEEMNASGIPASITLAQGILESGSGNSDLAKYANNHFGIKCTSDWKGKNYFRDDDQKNDCFRVYKDARESFRDHSEFLKRKRYSFLFQLDKNDYKSWAQGLKTAGYATNPRYPDMLINTIEKYRLDQYDQSETEKQKLVREDRVFTQINANIPVENKKFKPVETPPAGAKPILADGTYTVVKGDTLYNISKRFNLTVDQLKVLNNIADDGIKLGQVIKVK